MSGRSAMPESGNPSSPPQNGALTREEAERALSAAIGREVAKDIHDRIQASYEKRLAVSNRAISKAHQAQAGAEHNLMRAAGKREASQDRLILAVRQLRDQGDELAVTREERDRYRGFVEMVASSEGSHFAAAARSCLEYGDA